MITAKLLPWLLLALALAIGAAATMYNLWRAADERADYAEYSLEVERANIRIVEHVVTVEKEVIRRVPVIQRELVRLCDGDSARPAAPDAAPDAEAADVRARRLRELGSEIADSLQESERLIGLQEAVRNAGCAPM